MSTNARLDTDKVVHAQVPISDRVTHMEIEANVKTFLDWIAAAIILILSSPFVLISALLVKLTSRGPAFYTQMRLGLNGKPYVIYKLRSMYHECEKYSGSKWCSFRDYRVTPVGRILR